MLGMLKDSNGLKAELQVRHHQHQQRHLQHQLQQQGGLGRCNNMHLPVLASSAHASLDIVCSEQQKLLYSSSSLQPKQQQLLAPLAAA
jgi:hypothetical protein